MIEPQLDAEGWAVMPRAIDIDEVRDIRRAINLEFRSRGITATEVDKWQTSCFFPWLRDNRTIQNVCMWLQRILPFDDATDVIADPQILLRFPDWEGDWPLESHIDDLPPWAPAGSRYKWVAQVALTDCGPRDGCLAVWTKDPHGGFHDFPLVIETNAGDVVVLDPTVPHASTLNRGPDVRMCLYVRCITSAE